MKELDDALLAAARDLTEWGWTVTDDGAKGVPPPDSQYMTIMRKHLLPLLDDGGHKRLRHARISALRAELLFGNDLSQACIASQARIAALRAELAALGEGQS
jgi:hypothetical protein